MSTGIYVRIMREGKPVNLEIEDLTDSELKSFFDGIGRTELHKWCVGLARALRPAPLVFTRGEQTLREMAVELPRNGRLAVTVVTENDTLRKDETAQIAKELREIADIYENMSVPEDDN